MSVAANEFNSLRHPGLSVGIEATRKSRSSLAGNLSIIVMLQSRCRCYSRKSLRFYLADVEVNAFPGFQNTAA